VAISNSSSFCYLFPWQETVSGHLGLFIVKFVLWLQFYYCLRTVAFWWKVKKRMPRNTKFSTDWLKSLDANGDCISEWCVAIANDPYSARCRLCSRMISIANMGLRQLHSHSQGKKHQDVMDARKKQTFFYDVDTSSKHVFIRCRRWHKYCYS